MKMRRDEEGKLHRVVRHDRMDGYIVHFTRSCSGCTEIGEYGSGSEHYPTDPKHGCLIGAGCPECGYTGKRRQEHWVPFDMAAHGKREHGRWQREERTRLRRLHNARVIDFITRPLLGPYPLPEASP